MLYLPGRFFFKFASFRMDTFLGNSIKKTCLQLLVCFPITDCNDIENSIFFECPLFYLIPGFSIGSVTIFSQ